MKYTDIKRHLKPSSILVSRKTTINHAFAAALAPHDTFDAGTIAEALACLGQSADSDLACVYCERRAETWDHLVGIVKDSELPGYGHQVGNLVPCCKACNSKKGNKEWRKFLNEQIVNTEDRALRQKRIECYLANFAIEIDLAQIKEQRADWQRYCELRQQVFAMMREADEVAGRIRRALYRPPMTSAQLALVVTRGGLRAG